MTTVTSDSTSPSGRYDAWNEAICREFFGPEARGRPVYLDLEPDTVAHLGAAVGVDAGSEFAELCSAIKESLVLEGRGNAFARHLARLRDWSSGDGAACPPIVALLAFFSLVAERMHQDENFAANNYYGRLAEALGLDPHGGEIRRVERHFRKTSERFWHALNQWLERHGGRRGIPTAFAVSHRYVGLPISQAMVREEDRERLPSLFHEYGLDPGQGISRPEMERYMAEWVPSAASPTLRRLWDRPSVRERVVDVALVELDAWDGSAPGGAGDDTRASRESPLLLLAQLVTQPVPTLRLSLGMLGAVAGAGSAEFNLSGSPSRAAEAAIGVQPLVFLPGVGERWLELAEPRAVRFPDLLLGSVELVAEGLPRAVRRPSRVVIFRSDAELGRQIETSRLVIGEPHMLLVHKSLAEEVAEYLTEAALEGWVGYEPARLRGCPEDWCLFTGVRVVEFIDPSNDDLRRLVPSALSDISPEGGIRLANGRAWHRLHPPNVSAAYQGQDDAQLVLMHIGDVGDPLSYAENELATMRVRPLARISLEERNLPDGEYRAELVIGRTVQGTLRLRLVSADHPRTANPEEMLAHRPGTVPLWALSAERVLASADDEVPTSFLVHGALTHGMGSTIADVPRLPPPDLGRVPIGVNTPDEVAEEYLAVEATVTEANSCVESGAHRIELPAVTSLSGYQRREFEGVCRLCGLRKRQFGWVSKNAIRKATPKTTRKPRPLSELLAGNEPSPDGSRYSIDDAFDALCFEGEGSWAFFRRIAGLCNPETWFPVEFARLLQALGHVELALEPRSLEIREWQVSGSALVVSADGSSFLAGHRSEAMLARLEDAVMSLGGRVLREQRSFAPSAIRLQGLDREDLELVAADCALKVADSPGAAIAQALPPLHALLPQLAHPEPPVASQCLRFDFEAGRWVAAEWLAPGTLVQVRGFAPWYALIGAGGAAYRVDVRTGKLLAGAAQRHAMLAYDPESLTLRSRLGAQLPGLYERAAVLESGAAPVQMSDGTVHYQGVSLPVAQHLWRCVSRG